MSEPITIQVDPSVEGMQLGDRAYQAAIWDLHDYAGEASGVSLVTAPGESSEGTKGSLDVLLMSVGSPTAAVAVLRLWLQRDRKRSVKVTIRSPGASPIEIEASGEAISLEKLQSALDTAAAASRDHKS